MAETSTVACPSCGRASPAGQAFCGQCGASLAVPAGGQAPVSKGGLTGRRIAAIVGVALLIVFGVAVLGRVSGSLPTPATSAPVRSDAELRAEMRAAILEFPSLADRISVPGGEPDIAVTDGVLIVVSLTPDEDFAAQSCRTVAAITNDPATGKPLGIVGVTVIYAGEAIARCRP